VLRPGLLCLALLGAAPFPRQESPLARTLSSAEAALAAGDLERARADIERALERDPNSLRAWELLARWAERQALKDELVHALHRQLALVRAQGRAKAELQPLRERLVSLDPSAEKLLSLRTNFVEKLVKLAEGYEKAKRPHSAIRAYRQALALDREREDLREAIERVASAPDPSLAEDARPRDLLEGVSREWIAEHDARHATWEERARLERPNYVTHTNAGYEVLVRAAEAMEQMNAFYRSFFRYGAEGDKRSVSRIDLNIFRTRAEYLELGQGPPVEWSGGHFTGSAVETYVEGGFESMVGTLFHEAAHQFVSLATNASGWLNEGLASFFEGTRLLSNGTVVMNLPATHRLFPLVERMERGWMQSHEDGIDPADPNKEPLTAPTFRTVLENRYTWGPAWYAPTWGVVYFLYNYQDPSDGRFVYRKAFGEYIDASGGKSGEGAIETFTEVVLANPAPVTEGQFTSSVPPRTIEELNGVWKNYLVDLRDQQSGRSKTSPPYRDWARHARKRGDLADAQEFYEKALLATPLDPELLTDFGEFLAEQENPDRAAKLLQLAAAVLESAPEPDAARLEHLDRRLRKLDPQHQRLEDVRAALLTDATALVQGYLEQGLLLMAMELSQELGNELQEPRLFALFEQAVRRAGRSPARWRLAYDEQSLAGWNATGFEDVFTAQGELLSAEFGSYAGGQNDYAFLTLDQVTSGDFSLEAEVQARHGVVAFAGLVFGQKSASDFHGLVLFPPSGGRNGFVNLASFYGGSSHDTWRRNPVQDKAPEAAGDERSRSSPASAAFYKLRVDVTGRLVDVWLDDQFLATQEFPSLDVLRGSFGLIVGRGEARFRNIRYLAREARDPSAPIERKLRMTRPAGAQESVNGSWLGMVPPFPRVKEWLQEPRTSWEEAVGYPQLLVLWSCQQNDILPIDAWLRSLAEQQASIGLRIVNVVQGWDAAQVPAYLAEHRFPGSLAIDAVEGDESLTFELYDIARFQLPRLILLDIDGKVAWEGDPGFSRDQPWSGEETLLDVPLRELSGKRRLGELYAWKERWKAARAALAAADFERAAPVLQQAAAFDATTSAEVAEAAGVLAALESALGSIESTAATLADQGREPALDVLLRWGEAAGTKFKPTKAVSGVQKSAGYTAWKRVPTIVKSVLARVQAGKPADELESVLAKLSQLPGRFPAELVEGLRAAGDDPAALEALLSSAATLPARWLASEYFRW
jgi:Tfp pilus assembly protein PilF